MPPAVFLPVVQPTARFVLPESTLRLPSKLAVLVNLDMLAFPPPLARYLVLPDSTVLPATSLAQLVLLAARAPKPRQRPLLALPDSTHLETAQCARTVPLASNALRHLSLLNPVLAVLFLIQVLWHALSVLQVTLSSHPPCRVYCVQLASTVQTLLGYRCHVHLVGTVFREVLIAPDVHVGNFVLQATHLPALVQLAAIHLWVQLRVRLSLPVISVHHKPKL